MCGRFSYRYRWSDVIRLYKGLTPLHPQYSDEMGPRFNVRPGERQGAPVIRRVKDTLVAEPLFWSFIANEKAKMKPINAKAESLFEKWPWKFAWRQQRCVIPMSGFYEPKGPAGQKKRPQYYFQLPDGKPLLVAGIWSARSITPLDTFALITTTPNSQVNPVHDRMPAVLDNESAALWLSDSEDQTALQDVLHPWKGEALESWEVDRELLNSADDERCIEKIKA